MSENLHVPIRGSKLSYSVEIKRRICSRQTQFQLVEVVDTEAFGKMLLLDGHIQLAELDEHAYHESLVQIPLLSIGDARSALVIGGGDGGVLRELCRSREIEHIDIAEIDAGVIETCREHLPFLSSGAFEDPRVHLHLGDAFAFVRDSGRQYDLIVADSTDVYEDEAGAISEQLFTRAFYDDCRRRLSKRGLLVTQADNLVFCPYSLAGVRALFGEVFPHVGSYWALVPSFGGFSGFCWAGGQDLTPLAGLPAGGFKYLNDTTYRLAFSKLPF